MEKLLVINPTLTTTGTKPKSEKRRNNEKRKEKSRDAARCRRSREAEIFTELGEQLPLTKDEVDHLDKASIMRLAISFLKVRNMLNLFPNVVNAVNAGVESKMQSLVREVDKENFAVQSLDGFMLVLSGDGEITFVSENISELLGLSQIDLMGQSIWEYCHQCDHEELRDALHGRHLSPSELQNGAKNDKDFQPMVTRNFFLRMKCTLTSRGRSVNIKSASYKVIHVTGHVAYNGKYRQLVAIGSPLPHPANIEVPLGSNTFLTKHSLDMKFTYVDEKMGSLLGYQPEHLMAKSLFGLHYAEDSEALLKNFKCLISKGQMQTSSYRFLARYGGFAWVVTQATIVYDKQKPQSVVCVNYVISGIENEDEIYSCAQLEAREKEPKGKETIVKSSSNSNNTTSIIKSTSEKYQKDNNSKESEEKSEAKSVENNQKSENRPISVTASIFKPSLQALPQHKRGVPVTAKIFNRPQPATAKIFAPRTEDMNKGFLTFADDESGLTMLKDEPEDLTHLAPTAGDACIPLEETAPFFSDMFDEFIIPDSYTCSLLPDDINSLEEATSGSDSQDEIQKRLLPSSSQPDSSESPATHSSQRGGSATSISCHTASSNHHLTDPYINYRDEMSEASNSPHLMSPSGIEKSPDANSMPSLSSPGGCSSSSVSSGLPDDDLAFMTSLNMEDEMDLRAPYISMSETDDLPLLISDDLMWGAHPENVTNLAKELKQSIREQQESSLAALLCAQQAQQVPVERKKEPLVMPQVTTEQQIVNPLDVMGFKNGGEWSINDLIQLNAAAAASTTIKLAPTIITAATATVIPSNPASQVAILKKSNPQITHKRPHVTTNGESASKRAKPSSTTITLMNFQPAPQATTTPHLLQQLITAPQQPMQIKMMKQEATQEPAQPAPGSTNSVLMNLLVSGCDDVSMEPPALMMDFEEQSGFSGKSKLRSNPMISGGKLLRSNSTTPTNDPPPDDGLWEDLQEALRDQKPVIEFDGMF